MKFCETLTKHLRAVQSRDMPALIDTLPKGRITLITSDGRLVESVDEFIQMHRDWFGSKTWTLNAEVVNSVEGSDLALAIVRLDYRDKSPSGEDVRELSYLSLGFQKQGDRWLMVHDQNTPVKK